MEVEREIVVPEEPDEVWESLTDPERLEEWFATEVELDARPGGEGVFRWGDGDERHAVVRELEETERLVLDWDDGGSVAIELETTSRRHARPRRRVLSRVRPGARAARAGVDGARGGVDRVFAALGDAGRRSLVEAVAARGTATATELAAELPVTRQAVAKQLVGARRRGPAPLDPRRARDALRGDAGAARGRRRVDGLGRCRLGRAPGRAPSQSREQAVRFGLGGHRDEGRGKSLSSRRSRDGSRS